MNLHLDWCSYEAAKYAVEHWHYSKRMPTGKLVKIGVWEGQEFIGVMIFGRGANNHIGCPYDLEQTEVCELVRVALREHKCQTSKIIARAVRMLRNLCSELRLVVSYADPEQDHIGIVYQATNWIYSGSSQPQRETLGLGGEIVHKRTQHGRYGTIKGLPKSKILWKHKYLYPLDRAMRRQIAPLAKPYPKRESCGRGEIDSAPRTNGETGGASPTRPLSVDMGLTPQLMDG